MRDREQIHIAIDIGSSGLRVMVGSTSPDEVLTILATETITGVFLQDGLIVNLELIQNALKDIAKEIKNKVFSGIPFAVVNISGGEIICENHQKEMMINQKVRRKDLEHLIKEHKQEVQALWGKDYKLIHAIPQSTLINQQIKVDNPLGMSAEILTMGFHNVGIKKDLADNLRHCFRKAGIRIKGVVFNGLAAAEALLTAEDKQKGVMVVDMGAGTCDIVIYQYGCLVFSKSVRFGGERLSEQLAQHLKNSRHHVEQIKNQYGACKTHFLPPEPLEIESVLMGAPRQMVDKNLFCKIINEHYKEMGIGLTQLYKSVREWCQNGMVLTGGGAKVGGLLELMGGLLPHNTPLRIGHYTPIQTVEFSQDPAYSTLWGLLNYSVQNTQDYAWQDFEELSLWDNLISNLF